MGFCHKNVKCFEMLLKSIFVFHKIDRKCGSVYHSRIFLDPYYPVKCLCGKTWNAFESKVYFDKKVCSPYLHCLNESSNFQFYIALERDVLPTLTLFSILKEHSLELISLLSYSYDALHKRKIVLNISKLLRQSVSKLFLLTIADIQKI